jgi:hypothetical protein
LSTTAATATSPQQPPQPSKPTPTPTTLMLMPQLPPTPPPTTTPITPTTATSVSSFSSSSSCSISSSSSYSSSSSSSPVYTSEQRKAKLDDDYYLAVVAAGSNRAQQETLLKKYHQDINDLENCRLSSSSSSPSISSETPSLPTGRNTIQKQLLDRTVKNLLQDLPKRDSDDENVLEQVVISELLIPKIITCTTLNINARRLIIIYEILCFHFFLFWSVDFSA